MNHLMSTYRALCVGITGVALTCSPSSAASAGLNISPVVIEIDAARRAVAVTVSNLGTETVTFQTDTRVWRQVNGVDQFDATADLLVVPPIFKVAPNASQVFRVTLRQPQPSLTERTYRLLLEDISEVQRAVTGAAAVGFKFVHNLPVMVAPAGRVTTAARWSTCASNPAVAKAETCVRVFNAGNRRVRVQSLTVTGDGWQQLVPVTDTVNLLAGAEREWRFLLPSGQTGAVRGVQVQTARGETLQADAGGF